METAALANYLFMKMEKLPITDACMVMRVDDPRITLENVHLFFATLETAKIVNVNGRQLLVSVAKSEIDRLRSGDFRLGWTAAAARTPVLPAVGAVVRGSLNLPQLLTFKSFGEKVRSSFYSEPFVEFCEKITKSVCMNSFCGKLHFRKIVKPWTEEDEECSFLSSCKHAHSCKFVHYELDASFEQVESLRKKFRSPANYPPQWVNCDLRSFDLSVFRNVEISAVIVDPPWDIHMDLPYGTMADNELTRLNVHAIHDEGLIFLWVTSRALEAGRACLAHWGYRPASELVWIKTNQLQRMIRNGRTGHWLNHAKEHCLVGIKGLKSYARIDCDVIVSEVRETSHKPDELYDIIDRLVGKDTLKVELFGRRHNLRSQWITLGDQLGCSYIAHADLRDRMGLG